VDGQEKSGTDFASHDYWKEKKEGVPMKEEKEAFQSRTVVHIPYSLILFAFTLMILLLFLNSNALSADVTLEWRAKNHSNSVGYRIYYGTCSGIYTSRVDVGKVSRFTISDLADDQTYYFAITAYDEHGIDGRFSDEIVYRPDVDRADGAVYRMRVETISVEAAPLVLRPETI
jgi:hypothetical protein